MGARRPLIVANWKMHKTLDEATAFAREFVATRTDLGHVDAVIAPPFTALAAVGAALASTPVGLGAQTMWYLDAGPFTGEISPRMLLDCGASWVILGHSERRAYCGESDEAINRKVHAALASDITPIVAVGESADEHARGEAHDRVVAQTRAAFAGVDVADVARCVVAYEPIWAIGSGSADHPASANDVMGTIRSCVDGLDGARLLYGGSVKPDNIASFVAQPDIDGALVGTASLDPRSFAAMLVNARAAVAR